MENFNTLGFESTRTTKHLLYKGEKRNYAAWQKGLGVQIKGWLIFWLIAIITFMTTGVTFGQAVTQGTVPVVVPTGGFGMDGDLRASAIGDWLPGTGAGGSVLNGSGAPLNNTTTFHRVDLYNSGDNVFAGGQKKDDNPNTMTWINGNPSPAKNDINNLLMHIGRQSDGDIWISVGGDRESTNGNSFISIALHQALLSLHPETTGRFLSEAPAGTGGRTPGDVQISAEFTGGGSNPNLYLEEWKSVGGVYQWVSIPVPANAAFGSTNRSVLSGVPYDAFGGSSYPVNAFIEVSFNISAIYRQTSTPCVGSISSAFVMTKSSQSVSANLTDFVDPIQINLDINVGRPTAEGDEYCIGETINAITATGEAGATFKWYTGLNSEGKPTGTPFVGATYTPTIDNTVAGVHNFYVTQSIRGCESMHRVVTVKVLASPTIANPAIGAICAGATSASLTHNGVTADANQYRIDWNAAANTAGLADVGLTNLPTPTSPITISNTGSLAAATYSGTIYVKNTTTGCESAGDAVSLVVNANPTISNPAIGAICFGATSAALSYTGTTGSPNQYRIDWNAAANTAGLVDVALTNLPSSPITISGTGSLAAGTYSGTIYVKNSSTDCESAGDAISLAVNAQVGGPVVDYIAPKCDEIYFKVQIISPVANTKYTLSRVNYPDRVINYTSGTTIFENLEAGSGFSVVASQGDCSSEATTCDNFDDPESSLADVKLSSANSRQSEETTLSKQKMVAYPVPFSDKLNLEFYTEQDGKYQVSLYDLSGRLIRQLKSGTGKAGEMQRVEVDGSNLADGNYLVNVINGTERQTIRIIKKQ
jgi:hypothetical protein